MAFKSSYVLLSFLSLVVLSGCNKDTADKPKNIIYMIGDGMSMSHLTAYRHFKNSSASHVGLGDKKIPKTLFDQYIGGVASTHPEDDTLVTDSAASATALATAEKTYNGAIALDNDKTTLFTLLEQAKTAGMLTGTISTSQITHATPASFWAHNESRRNQNQIADAAFDDRIDGQFKTDLLLGGGTKYLIREDRNVVDEFKNSGWQYTDALTQIHELTELPALGLFAPKGLPFAIDHKVLPNRLELMTKKGLQLLDQKNPNGFFVMIEGSQIDWCSHGNDISCAMSEMLDFELAFHEALDFAKKEVILTEKNSRANEILIMTEITVYKTIKLMLNESGLTAPKTVQVFSNNKETLTIESQYIISYNPGLDLKFT